MRLISQTSTVLFCFLICFGLPALGVAQSILDSGSSVNDSNSQAKDKQFAENFWNYLLSNNYKHWSPAPGRTASHFASQNVGFSGTPSPHGASVKMYINRTAASNPNSLPVGSVLILENYRQDNSLETISVMYRTRGFNPSANDWYWVNYNADGSITSMKDGAISSIDNDSVRQASAAAPVAKKMVGRAVACIECHRSGGGDLAFFNNKIDSQTAIGPLASQPPKPIVPIFKPKLPIRPATLIKEGSLQNFILLPEQKSATSNAP